MKRILVIEDELSISKMLCMNLTMAGYEKLALLSGAEVLPLLEADAAFDLALVDVMLPDVSGFELIAPLSARNIPAIMLTAKDDIESKLRA